MKKLFYVFGTALILGAVSCDKENPVQTPTPPDGGESKFIYISATASQIGTRVAVNGAELHWCEGDAFRLFDNHTSLNDYGDESHEAAWCMDVDHTSIPEDGKAANFGGWIKSNPLRTEFYAIHPFFDGEVTDLTAVPISVPPYQLLEAPGHNAGLGDYMIEVGHSHYEGDPGEEDSEKLGFSFEHVTAIWDIYVANPGGLSVKGVKVMVKPGGNADGEEPFVIGGTLDITKDYSLPANQMQITQPITSGYIATRFDTPVDDADFKARIAMLPSTTIGSGATADGMDFYFVVTLADGTERFYDRTRIAKTFERGVIYKSQINLLNDSFTPSSAIESVLTTIDFGDFTSETASRTVLIQGPLGAQWETRYGAISNTSAITQPSLLLRKYKSTDADADGIAYSKMLYDLPNVTKIAFQYKRHNNAAIQSFAISYSTDKGMTWQGEQEISSFGNLNVVVNGTYILDEGLTVPSARLMFKVKSYNSTGTDSNVIIDDIVVYSKQ